MMSITSSKRFPSDLGSIGTKTCTLSFDAIFCSTVSSFGTLQVCYGLLFVVFIVYPIANAGDWQIESLYENC